MDGIAVIKKTPQKCSFASAVWKHLSDEGGFTCPIHPIKSYDSFI